MTRDVDLPNTNEALWRQVLLEGHRGLRVMRRLWRYLPSAPRCKVCHNPFGGVGGKLIAPLGYRPSRLNPNLCAACCEKLPPGGAEVDIGVLFADVRGSTALGEQLGATAFAALLNRFYRTATAVLVAHDALIDKLIGDEVMALFPFERWSGRRQHSTQEDSRSFAHPAPSVERLHYCSLFGIHNGDIGQLDRLPVGKRGVVGK
jgi:hypothetical protein